MNKDKNTKKLTKEHMEFLTKKLGLVLDLVYLKMDLIELDIRKILGEEIVAECLTKAFDIFLETYNEEEMRKLDNMWDEISNITIKITNELIEGLKEENK